MKRRFVWLGFAAITIGLFVLLYHGPGRAVLRGHAGDIAAAMLVYAVMGWLSPQTWIRFRAAMTFILATCVEAGQTLWNVRSAFADLTIGNTFDPWDILMYAIGVAICVACELRWRAQDLRTHHVAPSPRCASSP